jgi:hypothetical protein
MKKTIAPLTVIALLGLAAPASAGKAVSYKGKTSSGHKVTFKVKNKRIHNLTAGIRMSCIPIQGGGRPTGGSEVFGFRGSLRLKRHLSYSFKAKPAFHYNEVTMKNDLWLKPARQAQDHREDAAPVLVPDPEVPDRDLHGLQLPRRRHV